MYEVWVSEDERGGSYFLLDKWCVLFFIFFEVKICCIAVWLSV